MVAPIGRILKHRAYDETDARRALPEPALDRLEQRVAASERAHGGEIRICIEGSLPWSHLWRGASSRERARQLFGELAVWDTVQRNGVLIYVLLAEHAIEIVVDRAASAYVPHDHWRHVIEAMQADFRAGRYEEGLVHGIDAVDALLESHFPVPPDAPNPDELPNRPLIL